MDGVPINPFPQRIYRYIFYFCIQINIHYTVARAKKIPINVPTPYRLIGTKVNAILARVSI